MSTLPRLLPPCFLTPAPPRYRATSLRHPSAHSLPHHGSPALACPGMSTSPRARAPPPYRSASSRWTPLVSSLRPGQHAPWRCYSPSHPHPAPAYLCHRYNAAATALPREPGEGSDLIGVTGNHNPEGTRRVVLLSPVRERHPCPRFPPCTPPVFEAPPGHTDRPLKPSCIRRPLGQRGCMSAAPLRPTNRPNIGPGGEQPPQRDVRARHGTSVDLGMP